MPDNAINEIELIYKRHIPFDKMPKVVASQNAYDVLIAAWDQNRIDFVEDFKVLLLNRAKRLIGIYHAASGTSSGVIVDTKLILVSALKSNADSIILAHNHPTGNLEPSIQDMKQTEKMAIACRALDINMADHLIIANEGYYSFTDGGAYKNNSIGGQIPIL